MPALAEATAAKALAGAAGRWAVDMRVEASMLAIGEEGRVAGERGGVRAGRREEER